MRRSATVKTRITASLVLLAYIVALIVYYRYLSVHFGAALGYAWYAPSVSVVTIACGFALMPLLYIPLSVRKPSDFIFMLTYIAMYVPMVIVPQFAIDNLGNGLLWYGAWAGVSFTIAYFLANTRNVRILPVSLSWRRYLVIVMVVSLILLTLLTAGMGIPNSVPSLRDVYDVRSEYKKSLSGVGIASRYSIGWVQFFLVPLLFGMGIKFFVEQPKGLGGVLIGGGITVAVYVFALSGVKSAILSLIMIAGIWLTLGNGRLFIYRIFAGIVTVALLGVAIEWGLGSDFVILHVLRRFFVVPGLNAGLYYEFFAGNEKLMLSHSALSGMVGDIYQMDAGNLIGYHHYGNAATNSTAGFLADAYANFGVAGMVAFSAVLGIILNLVDSVSRRSNVKVAIVSFSIFAYVLTNTGLFTSLLSYGMILMIIAIYAMPYD